MADNRPRVTTDKMINLEQLTAELGGVGLCLGDGVIVAAEGAQVTQQQLEDAVTAHVAVFPPPPPTIEELAAEVQGIKDRAAAKAAEASPSAKDVAASVAG